MNYWSENSKSMFDLTKKRRKKSKKTKQTNKEACSN